MSQLQNQPTHRQPHVSHELRVLKTELKIFSFKHISYLSYYITTHGLILVRNLGVTLYSFFSLHPLVHLIKSSLNTTQISLISATILIHAFISLSVNLPAFTPAPLPAILYTQPEGIFFKCKPNHITPLLKPL